MHECIPVKLNLMLIWNEVTEKSDFMIFIITACMLYSLA
jgi:hypothetical protein